MNFKEREEKRGEEERGEERKEDEKLSWQGGCLFVS